MAVIDRRDGVTEGLHGKRPCRAATTANITLSDEQTIDGVAIVDGDSVLVWNQTDGTANGVYVASTGNWTRRADFDGNLDVVSGTLVFVTSGTTHAHGLFYISAADPITIDTTNLTFAKIYVAGVSTTGTGPIVLQTGPTLVNPIVGTQSPGDNSTKAASTAFVTAAVAASTVAVSSLNLANGKVTESHSGGAATYAVKTLAGADPSSGSPVSCTFPDGSQLSITAALSLTIPSTATMGVPNGVPFRLWLALIDDGGTARLGVRNCSSATGISGFPGNGVLSATATPASTAKVTYSNAAVSTKPFVIIAAAEYTSGLTVAGTWDASPNRISLFVPGMQKPGEIVQTVEATTTTVKAGTTTSYVDTNLTASITPTSAINQVMTSWNGSFQIDTASIGAYAVLRRSGTNIGIPQKIYSDTTNLIATVGGVYGDAPYSAGALTYTVAIKLSSTSGSPNCYFASSDAGGQMMLAEVVG